MKYEFVMPIMRKYIFNNNKIYGGPTDEIFGSDDGFALFLNGMGFTCGLGHMYLVNLIDSINAL